MNRKQRKGLEKEFGLLEKYANGTDEEKAEIKKRRREMGKKIHQQNIQNIENAQRKQADEKQASIIQGLLESGYSEKAALKILNDNKKLEDAREEKQRKKMEKRADVAQ